MIQLSPQMKILAPLAYVRKGDPQELQNDFRNAGCLVKEHPFRYRSLHYVVRFQPEKKLQRVEIQVRTIFEEGWSEIDHRVRYPLHSSDRFLADFLRIFNRLAGSADEMGTFIQGLSVHLRDQAAKLAQIEVQLDARERVVEEAVSTLQISEKEKAAPKKQIQRDTNVHPRSCFV